MHDGSPRPAAPGRVDAERGVVDRAAFVSQEVFRLELERIFDRSWMFLAHVTEIPEAGDYVARRLGSAPVIVARGDDGAVHVLLNSCRHRGTRLCRAEMGNARRFVCPYHGWSYERDGRLITTTFDAELPEGMDFAQWGLVRAPRIEVYKGLVFACWDAEAIDLARYLGDMRWYLDAFFWRTPAGMTALAPPHRWRVRTNWKVGALNFIGDSMHVATTHVGPITLDRVRSDREGFTTAGEDSFQVVTDEGHGCTLTYLAPGMREEHYRARPPELQRLFDRALVPDQAAMLDGLRVAVGNVFPNFSFIESQATPGEKAIIVRQWQPVSATEMEILSWVLVEDEASAGCKERVLNHGFHNFGAAGVFEQDDLEIWASATEASDNRIAAQFPYSFHTGVARQPLPDHRWPGRAYKPVATEVAQLAFLRHWDERMTSGR